jgi:DNA uptake protein ComE-like DNA-binding protein
MSPAEAKGVIVIFGIIIFIIVLMFGADWYFSQKPQNLVISSPKILDSLTVSLDSRKPNYGNQSNYGQKYDSNKKVYKNFNFDPNTTSVAQFEALGLPKFIAERIEKYRNKGGKFRKKEDLAKIYGILPETFERLEPYITLPSAYDESLRTPQAEATNVDRTVATVASSTPSEGKAIENKPINAKTNTKQPVRFDLNTGDTTDFMKIKGIGSGYAKRIIKFRDMLGGFANAEQIKETYGLPPETVEEILKYGFLKDGVKKLKINQLSLSEFRHPYLKYFQAKAIITYREQHGAFKNSEDLKQIKILDEATILKILPYIEF